RNFLLSIYAFESMSKQPYRSELGMISDILQVAMDYGRQGTIITTIARRANLSHYTAKPSNRRFQ
ncbi:hypothetical protein, partial [Nitrosococcus oceani]|uniref:hypothetical protein n=1 Tax=Nitrosococcus oceani TaxID=1229 RepID=UPI001E5687C9